MGLLDRIKNIFKRKASPEIASKDMAGYNLSNINIPKYEELSDEEKAIVDKYFSEINLNQIENMLNYGERKTRYAAAITDLLVNLAHKIEEQHQRIHSETIASFGIEERLEMRLNDMISIEKLESYASILIEIEKEAKDRTVALEKFKEGRKGLPKIFSVFRTAEIINYRMKQTMLEETIGRMKVLKQMVENQIRALTDLYAKSSTTIAESLETYCRIEDEEHLEKEKQKAIKQKAKELQIMASVVMPEEGEVIPQGSEEEQVKQLAKLEAKLEIYGYLHKEDVEALRKQVEALRQEIKELRRPLKELGRPVKELSETEKTKEKEKKEEILRKIEEIRIKYKVLSRYVKEEDKEALYSVKFNVLTFDINNQEKSPFGAITNQEEKEYYIKILEDKIEQLGKNKNLVKMFGEAQVSKAIGLIMDILKKGKKTIEVEEILKDINRLSLLLAFDSENGIENLVIDKNEYDGNLYEEIFEWNDRIPLKSVFELIKEDKFKKYNYWQWYHNKLNIHSKNPFEELYILYAFENEMRDRENWSDGYGSGSEMKLPEGIRKLRLSDKMNKYYKLYRINRYSR